MLPRSVSFCKVTVYDMHLSYGGEVKCTVYIILHREEKMQLQNCYCDYDIIRMLYVLYAVQPRLSSCAEVLQSNGEHAE